MLGKPIIKGTRITIELLLRKLAEGYTMDELLTDYPHLTKEDILAAMEYASPQQTTPRAHEAGEEFSVI